MFPHSYFGVAHFGQHYFPDSSGVSAVVAPTTGRRRQRGQRRTEEEQEKEYRQWAGLPPPQTEVVTPVVPVILPTVQIPAIELEIHGVTRFGFSTGVKVSHETSHNRLTKLGIRAKGTTAAEIQPKSHPHTFTLVVDRSKVVSEFVRKGGGGFKFRTQHRVEQDLWRDRPIEDDEADAVIKAIEEA